MYCQEIKNIPSSILPIFLKPAIQIIIIIQNNKIIDNQTRIQWNFAIPAKLEPTKVDVLARWLDLRVNLMEKMGY